MHPVRPVDGIDTDGTFLPKYVPRFVNPEQFIDAKVKILREHFKMQITEEDIEYLRGFKTEVGINAAVRVLINKYWE